MLREIYRFRNYAGPSSRRLFTDSDMDLYVWFNREAPERFHFVYDKQGCAQSVSWNCESGFEQRRFAQLDALAQITGLAQLVAPLFMAPTANTAAQVLAYRFLHASDDIVPWLADFIYARLLEHPGRNTTDTDQGAVLRSF